MKDEFKIVRAKKELKPGDIVMEEDYSPLFSDEFKQGLIFGFVGTMIIVSAVVFVITWTTG